MSSSSPEFWSFITRLGEAQILLPVALALSLWLAWRARATPIVPYWLALLGIATLITAATKIAFIGWGIGSAALDFTGVSGHAMFAAAIYPVVCRLALSGHGLALQRLGWGGGLALAGLIAWSRLVVQAHSPSESLIGFLLGGSVSALAIWIARPRAVPVPWWMPALLVAWFALVPMNAPRSITHDVVTRLALMLSGRSQPYLRQDLHRDAGMALDSRVSHSVKVAA